MALRDIAKKKKSFYQNTILTNSWIVNYRCFYCLKKKQNPSITQSVNYNLYYNKLIPLNIYKLTALEVDGTVSKQVKVIQRKAFTTAQGLKDIGCAQGSAVFNQQKTTLALSHYPDPHLIKNTTFKMGHSDHHNVLMLHTWT